MEWTEWDINLKRYIQLKSGGIISPLFYFRTMKNSMWFFRILILSIILSSCNNTSKPTDNTESSNNRAEVSSNKNTTEVNDGSVFIGKWKQEVTANISGASAMAGLEITFKENGTYVSKVNAMGNSLSNSGSWKTKGENELELNQGGDIIILTCSADKTVLTNESEGIVLQKQ